MEMQVLPESEARPAVPPAPVPDRAAGCPQCLQGLDWERQL